MTWELVSDDIVARDVAQQADPLDADARGDAADLPGQTRTGRGEVRRRRARDHARPQHWKVGAEYYEKERVTNIRT